MSSIYFTISLILHPVFVTTILTLIYLNIYPSESSIPDLQVYKIVLVNTLIFPIVTVLLLKGLGFIKSIYLKDNKDRIVPIIASMTFYFWAYLVARNIGIESHLQELLLAGFLNLSGLLFLGMYMKPSIHSSTWTVATLWLLICAVMLSPEFYLFAAIALFFLLLIFYVRGRMKAHTKTELITGVAIGTFSILISFVLTNI